MREVSGNERQTTHLHRDSCPAGRRSTPSTCTLASKREREKPRAAKPLNFVICLRRTMQAHGCDHDPSLIHNLGQI